MLKTNIDKELNNQVDYYNQQIKLMSSTNLQDFHKILYVLVRLVIQTGDITRTMVYWKTVYIQPEP